MSEIEYIYKFFREYPVTAVIAPDGDKFILYAAKQDSEDNPLLYFRGETIGDSIRQFYEAIEKESVK